MKKSLLLITLLFSCTFLAAQTLYDQLVFVNEQWKHQADIDPALKRAPAKPMTESALVEFHLQQTEKLLRSRNVCELPPKLQTQRNLLLNVLHQYTKTGLFPVNTNHQYRQPYFIDAYNTYCAVGYLMKESGADHIARQISQSQNYNYLFDIAHPQFMEWVSTTGLTVDELTLIQPAYGEWPIAITEFHYNNSGTDVNEYIEVNMGSISAPYVTEIRFFNNSGFLYKTILPTYMHTIYTGTYKVASYVFPTSEDFADEGRIELYSGATLRTKYTYNATSLVLDDYNFFTTRTFNVGESESTSIGNSLTFCGNYSGFPALTLQVLPATINTINSCTILPLQLIEFTAAVNRSAVHLNWKTSLEFQSNHFEIERSINGIDFENVDQVKATGTSNEIKQYSFIDKYPGYKNHYRLKQVDADGKFTYSKIVFVKVEEVNPLAIAKISSDILHLYIHKEQSVLKSLALYDMYGRKIKELALKQGHQQVDISNIAGGKYILQLLTSDGEAFNKSFVK
jgi:hypothetical protein